MVFPEGPQPQSRAHRRSITSMPSRLRLQLVSRSTLSMKQIREVCVMGMTLQGFPSVNLPTLEELRKS